MSFWLPNSACDAECLAPTPLVSPVRRAARLVALAGVLLAGGLVLPVLPAGRRTGALRRFAGAALRAMGIRVRLRGALPARRALLVANHISWLDILVLLAVAECRLVAKTEVRGWPVIGKVAARTGTVFIDRVRPKSLPPTVAQLRAGLAGGAVFAVFPEGTTSCGRQVGPFRPAMFQAALDAHVPVVPVSLRFTTPGAMQPATAAAFIGAETLLASLRRIIAARGLTVRVRPAAAIHPDAAATRRALARLASDELRAEWPARTPTAAPATPSPPHRTPVAPEPAPVRALFPLPVQRAGSDTGSTAGLPPAA
jgi:1-acyl-sn-glycerol-3-phosphate acyltransferase